MKCPFYEISSIKCPIYGMSQHPFWNSLDVFATFRDSLNFFVSYLVLAGYFAIFWDSLYGRLGRFVVNLLGLAGFFIQIVSSRSSSQVLWRTLRELKVFLGLVYTVDTYSVYLQKKITEFIKERNILQNGFLLPKIFSLV